jgi:hypothetical protein
VVLEESFQGFPFSGDSDKVLFVWRGRRICHRKRLRARLDRADMRGITRAAMRGVLIVVAIAPLDRHPALLVREQPPRRQGMCRQRYRRRRPVEELQVAFAGYRYGAE